MTLKARIDRAEAGAQARAEAEAAATWNEWQAWMDACIAKSDVDSFFRWVANTAGTASSLTPEQLRETREFWGEYLEWRDGMGQWRVMFLLPSDIASDIAARMWKDSYPQYLTDRRRFLALVRYNLLGWLGRLQSSPAVEAMREWHQDTDAAVLDASGRIWLWGLKWEAIKPTMQNVCESAEFESLARNMIEPSEAERRSVCDGRYVPNELADALADEWGL